MARRVLIAWEFGSGLGHLACLYAVGSTVSRMRRPSRSNSVTCMRGLSLPNPSMVDQVVQHDLRDIELRVAVAAPLTVAQKKGLSDVLAEALQGEFVIRVSDFVDALPEPPSMKFEEFVSHI